MDATEAPADLRVLVVDDDDDLRTLVVRVVEQAGYAVDSAADGQVGLDRLAGQIYDVILSDVRMPWTGSRSTRRSAGAIRPRLSESS